SAEAVARRAQTPSKASPGIEQSLELLLDAPTIASKRWVFEQFDGTVRGRSVITPGGDAGVLRVDDSGFGLAMTVDGNARHVLLDPYEGGKGVVAEAARTPTPEEVPACEPVLRDLEVCEEFYEPVPAMALSGEVDIRSLEDDASDQDARVVYRFGEGVKTSRPRFLDRLALKPRFAEYEPHDAEIESATSLDDASCEVLPYETLPCEDEPCEDWPYIVSSCESERVEPRFDESASGDSTDREPGFGEPRNAPPAYREPLLSDLLAAA
ncbi:MAG TPA: hypothetical protein PLX43_08825, partial [Nitrobacter sp.]|nr:hypothetical protein [Nitrobacter sp.]